MRRALALLQAVVVALAASAPRAFADGEVKEAALVVDASRRESGVSARGLEGLTLSTTPDKFGVMGTVNLAVTCDGTSLGGKAKVLSSNLRPAGDETISGDAKFFGVSALDFSLAGSELVATGQSDEMSSLSPEADGSWSFADVLNTTVNVRDGNVTYGLGADKTSGRLTDVSVTSVMPIELEAELRQDGNGELELVTEEDFTIPVSQLVDDDAAAVVGPSAALIFALRIHASGPDPCQTAEQPPPQEPGDDEELEEPPVEVVAEIGVSVTGDLDVSNSTAVDAFKAELAQALAGALGVGASAVNVTAVRVIARFSKRRLTANRIEADATVTFEGTSGDAASAVEREIEAAIPSLANLTLPGGFEVEGATVESVVLAPVPGPTSPERDDRAGAEEDYESGDDDDDDGSSGGRRLLGAVVGAVVAVSACVVAGVVLYRLRRPRPVNSPGGGGGGLGCMKATSATEFVELGTLPAVQI